MQQVGIDNTIVQSSRALLATIAAHPNQFSGDDQIINALRSQGAFATLAFNFHSEGQIHEKRRVSLNSLKKQCELTLERGYKELDRLRLMALERLLEFKNKDSRPKKRTKTGLAALVTELETLLVIQRKANHTLLFGLNEAIRELGVISRESNAVPRERLADAAISALRETIKLSSFRTPPIIVESNITQLRGQPSDD